MRATARLRIVVETFRPTRFDFCGLIAVMVLLAWPSWDGGEFAVLAACLLMLASLVAASVIAVFALRSRNPDLRVAGRIAVQACLLAILIASVGVANVAVPARERRVLAHAEQVIERVEAYRRDHGEYPPSLEKLVSADGLPLPSGAEGWRYSTDGRTFTLDAMLRSGHCYISEHEAWLKG